MVELNPYVRSQLYRSRTGTSLLSRLESTRSSDSETSTTTSSHPPGFVGPTVQEANIVSSDPRTVYTSFLKLPIQEKIGFIRTAYNVPSEIKESGASREYRHYVMGSYLGLDVGSEEKRLGRKLQSSYPYMSKYASYSYEGKQIGWSELHGKEPALFLTKNVSGVYEPQYDFLRWREQYRKKREQKGLGVAGGVADVSQSFLNIFDVGTWKATVGGTLPEYLAEKQYRDVMDLSKGKFFDVWTRVQVPAYINVILPTITAAGIGAGIGAFKATSIGSRALLSIGSRTLTTAGAIELGIGGYASYETGKSFIKDPLGTSIALGMASPFALAGYRAGHRAGYGYTEAYLYGKHTYGAGTPELIRYKEAIKIGRQTQYIKSSYAKPLDFAKDIMRLRPSEANKLMGYLRSTRGSVIGGSGSSYTQVKPSLWSRWRGGIKPRDVDLLVKDVTKAKRFFGSTPHKIDIHGYEFGGKGGRYHRFGFITQSPKRIGEFKYMQLGEQSFRKGIGATTLETSYRAFKDVPDFIMASEQLIGSSKVSWNPFTRLRGSIASKHLEIFKNPFKSRVFGKTEGFFGKGIKRFFKPSSEPLTVYRTGGYIDYSYPSYMFPSGYTGFSLGYTGLFDYKPSGYRSSKTVSNIANFYNIPKTMSYNLSRIMDYKPLSKYSTGYKPINEIFGYKPSKYISSIVKGIGYKPSAYRSGDKPSFIPSKKVKVDVWEDRRKPFKIPSNLFDLGYKYREFDVVKLFKNL